MTRADTRIRRFSAITWLAGSAAAIVVAFVTMPFIAVNPATGGLLFDDPNAFETRPWEDPDLGELPIRDGEIVGSADGGYIDLPPGDALWSIGSPSGLGEGQYVAVYQQVDSSARIEDDRPAYLTNLRNGRGAVAMPATTEGRLWFSPQLTDWRAPLTLQPATPIETPTITGEGRSLLLYEGDALSARVTFEGEGFLTVDALQPGLYEDVVSGVDRIDERASWSPGDRVVFRIEADEGSGPWTITLDEPASPPSTPPTP
ncbi:MULTISPECIES: hypothetical protein [unclassified Microbacterium]|uniref:hypothetical protein n=1 Tax=unclassified Microbacterium TaxID=2609290 RepID=UPI0038634B4E